MKYFLCILTITIFFPVPAIGQTYNKEVEAKIKLNVQEDKVVIITGTAYNITETNKSLRYVLSVIKSGVNGNNTKNDQQGRLVLQPGEKKELSTTTVNIIEDDRTIILLLIYSEDQLIGKDRKVFDGLNELGDVNVSSDNRLFDKEDVQNNNADGVFSKGMVIEDTKTKPGNDFYRYFYSNYLANGIGGDKIVKIKEDFALASTTRISVIAENDVVTQFYVNPRSDFLKEMAQKSVYAVNNYFLRLRKNKEQIKRY
ncbi:CsgE family curli-type amyloid fiber assembly protein [Zobellia alginiliquefaciens]|uniref:CsgE family curli-type amyloid fiber assembly protein n=1 Tax=Zobellia alginiliquefaciens TaxID=3032586 RepID=UPI0023E0A5A5|nr:CsgE family curli-type amyloid fiber assembly protein [Zobellia alginiliquefaciens]